MAGSGAEGAMAGSGAEGGGMLGDDALGASGRQLRTASANSPQGYISYDWENVGGFQVVCALM